MKLKPSPLVTSLILSSFLCFMYLGGLRHFDEHALTEARGDAALNGVNQPGAKVGATYLPLPTPSTHAITPEAIQGDTIQDNAIHVKPITRELYREFHIPDFYTKGLIIRGIPVVSSAQTSDYALLECAYTLDHMFAGSPSWVQEALNKGKVRMAVMSSGEFTMDLPENQAWQTDRSPKTMAYWDERARGMVGFPDASCAEENLLNLASDPYKSENITIHEFSHTVASALKEVRPQWYAQLVKTYKQAMAAGRFAHSYAATNEQEYWAEGAQAWFDCAVAAKDSTVHNGIWNREQLKDYDPPLASLLTQVYGDGTWRYIRTDGRPLKVNGHIYSRSAADLAHLAGIDRKIIPAFDIGKSPRIQALKAIEQDTKTANSSSLLKALTTSQ